MDFEFLDPPAIVQKKKKYQTFTVTPIGGPAEIIKWRQQQEAKESLYRLRLGDRNNRIANFESKLGQKLDAPTIHTTSWAEKQAFATEERQRLKKAEDVVLEYPPWESAPEPKKTLFQRFKGFIVSLWQHANF